VKGEGVRHGAVLVLVTATAGGPMACGKHPPESQRRLEVVTRDGTVKWAAPVAAGEPFELAYLHSSERCVWTQHYVAGPGRTITQTGSTFPCFGAGMPVAGQATRSKEGFRVAAPRVLDSLDMMNWNGAAIALRYRDRSTPFRQWFSDYDTFSVRIR